jgi:hypothetical protein
MSEYRSILPPRKVICERLTEVAREQKMLRELLRLSAREERARRERTEHSEPRGGAS